MEDLESNNWPITGACVNDLVVAVRPQNPRPARPYPNTHSGVGVIVDVLEPTLAVVLWPSGVTALSRTAWLKLVSSGKNHD